MPLVYGGVLKRTQNMSEIHKEDLYLIQEKRLQYSQIETNQKWWFGWVVTKSRRIETQLRKVETTPKTMLRDKRKVQYLQWVNENEEKLL